MVDLDLNLQEKDLLREMIVEEDVEKIALWHDGEWSIYLTEHFLRRRSFEKPIHIMDIKAYFRDSDFFGDSVENLIERLEGILNENRQIG